MPLGVKDWLIVRFHVFWVCLLWLKFVLLCFDLFLFLLVKSATGTSPTLHFLLLSEATPTHTCRLFHLAHLSLIPSPATVHLFTLTPFMCSGSLCVLHAPCSGFPLCLLEILLVSCSCHTMQPFCFVYLIFQRFYLRSLSAFLDPFILLIVTKYIFFIIPARPYS